MKLLKSKSLRVHLTLRLVLLQALALFGLSAFLLVLVGGVVGSGDDMPNPYDANVVASSITQAADGTLAVTPSPALQDLIATTPGFWYVVIAPNGAHLSHGDVPTAFTTLDVNIGNLANTLVLDAAGHEPAAILRLVETSYGTLHIIVGNGRRIPVFSFVVLMASRAALPSIGVLAIIALVAIPWIVRRQFRGVDAAATQAERIDTDKRGVRLPLEGVPSEISPLVQAVNNALERLDAGHLRQKRFLADAAHELKTPIAVLQARIETSVSGPERAKLLADVARLGTLAEQLLDLQRIEQDHQTRFQTVDMVTIGKTVTLDLAPLAIDAGYDLSFEAARDTYPFLGDQIALERAVTNLVQNAIMHGGGSGNIAIRIEADGALEVSDEGPGVPEEHRRAIFEPFYRLRPLDHGSGLGLGLVKDVVHAHGGNVSVGQAPGGGALFRIWIPANPTTSTRAGSGSSTL